MKRLIGGLMVLILCLTLPTQAQEMERLSVGAAAGSGHMPLSKWESFAATAQSGAYRSDDLGKYGELWLRYRVSERHSLRLGVEYVSVSASGTTLMVAAGNQVVQAYSNQWDFTAVPVSLAYEVNIALEEADASPFIGCGLGYYFSEVEAKSEELVDTIYGDTSGSRTGNGFGICVYAGVRAPVIGAGSVVTQLRYRYADGMVFTEDEGDASVEFTGVDVTVGFEWSFM